MVLVCLLVMDGGADLLKHGVVDRGWVVCWDGFSFVLYIVLCIVMIIFLFMEWYLEAMTTMHKHNISFIPVQMQAFFALEGEGEE